MKGWRGARSLFAVVGVVSTVYCVYLAALYQFQDRLLFPGTLLPVPSTASKVTDAQLIELPEKDGNRPVAFFIPANRVDGAAHKKGALIIAHGNGELADYLLEGYTSWRQLGVALLFVEYPGYGRAAGKPSEQSIAHAMTAAFDWLASRPDVDPSKIAAHGVSLGGGAVGLLMRERPLAGVILHATFTSVRAFAKGYGAPGFLLKNKFDTIDVVRNTKIPVRVIHGDLDTIVPSWHGVALATAANDQAFKLWPCGHVCFHEGGKPLFDAVKLFLSDHRVVE
jgi:uncharacterized protein